MSKHFNTTDSESKKKTICVPAFSFALVFSTAYVVGYSFNKDLSFSWCTQNSVLAAALLLILMILAYHLCKMLFKASAPFSKSDGSKQIARQLNARRSLLLFALLILLWSPFLLAFFPGSVTNDAMHQLYMYLSQNHWNNHHPALSTAVFGMLFQLGSLAGSDNYGVFTIVIIQAALQAIAIVCILREIDSLKAPRFVLLVALAFFSLNPIFGSFAQLITKDTLFTSFFALWVIAIAKFFVAPTNSGKDRILIVTKICVLSLLVSFFRHNGFYVVVLTIAPILIWSSVRKLDTRPVWGTSLFFTSIIYISVSLFLFPILDITPGSRAEAMSIPFQQTAAYVQKHVEDISEQDEKAIARVLDYNALADAYNPQISDPVKSSFNKEATLGDLAMYFSAWTRMFIKHPLTYINATIANSYGYVYPNIVNYRKDAIYRFYISDYSPDSAERTISVQYNHRLAEMRSGIAEATRTIVDTPLLFATSCCGVYTLILVWAICMLCYRREYSCLMMLLPQFIIVLTCLASPVNADMRYLFPVVLLTPFTIWWSIAGKTDSTSTRTSKQGKEAR